MVCSIEIAHAKVGESPVSYILSIANSFNEEVAVKVKSNSEELLVEPEKSKLSVDGSVDVKVTYLGKAVPPDGKYFVRIFMVPIRALQQISLNNWTNYDKHPLPHAKVIVNFKKKPTPPAEDKRSEEEKAEDLRIAREHCRLCKPSTSGLRKWEQE